MGFTVTELFEAFGAGVYLFFGIVHLDLWLRRRDRLGHLLLACAGASALAVDITGLVAPRVSPSLRTWIAVSNALAVAAATIFLFELVSWLDRAATSWRARALQTAVLAAGILASVASPALFPAFGSGIVGLLVWAMIKAFRASRPGDRDSGIVARGLVVLIACLVADVLRELGVVTLPGGLPIIGFIVLFLASARSLNDRFGREEEASRTDTLTGLLNRRGFLEASDAAVAQSRRTGYPIAVVIADIDHFKRVNDALGHAAGDAVLKALAAALRSAVRAHDVVARWGGEEFIFLLPDTDCAGAVRAAETLRTAAAASVARLAGAGCRVTLSLGVAEHEPGGFLEESIARADAALYRAKDEGRDRVAS